MMIKHAKLPAVVLATLWAFVVAGLCGCDDEKDPTDPEGAYLLFADALFAGDGETLWQRVDVKTHQAFNDYYDLLVEMDKQIVRYLPPTDHKLARKQSGTELLKGIKDGKGLFLKVIKPLDAGADQTAVERGAQVEEIEVSEDKLFAKVLTKGGQEFVLTRDADEVGRRSESWTVMLSKSSNVVESNLSWLSSNNTALTQTVEDLIAEERTMRERVIAELMDVAPGDGPNEN